jgi:hypothetical protein
VLPGSATGAPCRTYPLTVSETGVRSWLRARPAILNEMGVDLADLVETDPAA